MNDLALSVRTARPEDAADLARIYIESWQDTYAGVVSHALLGAMSHKGHTARWRTSIRTMGSTGAVLVAEDARYGAIGLCSLGAVRDRGLGFEGEVYTLYVAPDRQSQGLGRSILMSLFQRLVDTGHATARSEEHTSELQSLV